MGPITWPFLDNDGHITKEEMLKVVQSMMSLVERSDNFTRYESPKAKVDFIFSVMDEVRLGPEVPSFKCSISLI